jgi:hypothetical protein
LGAIRATEFETRTSLRAARKPGYLCYGRIARSELSVNITPSLKSYRVELPATMALAPGARIGPYEITAQIGAGGMDI